MRRVMRGALPLLAAALGFARPASAQPADPADPIVVISADADDNAPPAPPVVPHRHIVLEPMKEPSGAAAKPAMDLLAPPAAPPAWWTRAVSPSVPVAPSGLPGTAPAGRSAPAPSSAVRPVAVTLRPLTTTAAAPAHTWPAPFLVSHESEPTEVKQAAHVGASDELAPPPWENVEAPAFADLRRRVETIGGRQVTGVSAVTQPNGVVVVRVRVRNTGADPDKGRVIELPQAPGAGVRILLEVAR